MAPANKPRTARIKGRRGKIFFPYESFPLQM
jgi:hypothetical protein